MPATPPGSHASNTGWGAAECRGPRRTSALGAVFGLFRRLPRRSAPAVVPVRRAAARAFDLHGLPPSPRQAAALARKAPDQGQPDAEDEAFLRSLREAGL